jgi:hypothetical protein
MLARAAVSFLIIIIATLAIGLANDAVARSGHGFAPTGVRPFFHSGAAHFRAPATVHAHGLRRGFFRHRRFGWPGLWGDGPWYGPSYDATGYSAPEEAATSEQPISSYPAPSAPVTERIIHVIPYRPGCDSETQRVPWKGGGERSITVVRC